MRNLCLCLVAWFCLCFPPHCCGLVRYGDFLHVGSLVFRYVPDSLQIGRLSEQKDGLVSLHVQDFMTYVGMERLTFMADLTSAWDSTVNIGSLDSTVLHQDVYYQYGSNFSFGVGFTHIWLSDRHCAIESKYTRGSQLGFLLRWRW